VILTVKHCKKKRKATVENC